MRDPGITSPEDGEPVDIDAALLAERLRLYRASVWSAGAGQVLVAMLMVSVLWGGVDRWRLLTWLACWIVTLGVRLGVGWQARRDIPPGAVGAQALLRRIRLSAAASGVAWGLAGVLLFPDQDLQSQTFLAFVLAGMAAGSLALTAYDLVNGLSFATLAVLPLSVRLLAEGSRAPAAMAGMVLLYVAFLALTGWRVQRNVRDTLAAREAEARRARSLLHNQQRLQQISGELSRKSDALQVTLDSMDQGILSMGADGRTSFYNQRLSALIDLPEAFLAARPTMADIARYQLEHGHYGENLNLVEEGARSVFGNWLEGRQPEFPSTYYRRTPSGVMLEVKTRYLPGGGLVRTFSDVTAFFDAQQRLQDSQAQARKLALVAAHTDNAVSITDAGQRIEWVNQAFVRLSGYGIDELVGRRAADLLRGPATDPVEAARMDEELQRTHRSAGELQHHAKDGRTYWFAVESHAILDESGRVMHYISVGRDTSASRAAELALRAARDEAERASRAKSEFLSAMSHELRTPMNAILGFAQLLDTDPAHRLHERQHGHVHQILRAGAHLLELIDDVLDLARVEAGKQPISVEPVRVSALLDECLTLMRPAAQERQIRLDDRAPPACDTFVAADRTRLKQVLLNLLSNAVKYNRLGGEVRLACSADGDAVRISVSDTGHGLDAEQCARLFNPFERVGAEHGAVQGAGIGLALSKRMVELMHGRIGVDSEVGRGSTFWLQLGRAEPPAALAATPVGPARATAAAAQAASAGTATVLYIEDNPANVALMAAILEREPGVRLVSARQPELGLELARSEHPDLVLLDIQLPGIDGYEVLRRLRAAEATRALPVVAISANAMRSDIDKGLRAGFDGYLTKPFEIDRLLQVVRQARRR